MTALLEALRRYEAERLHRRATQSTISAVLHGAEAIGAASVSEWRDAARHVVAGLAQYTSASLDRATAAALLRGWLPVGAVTRAFAEQRERGGDA